MIPSLPRLSPRWLPDSVHSLVAEGYVAIGHSRMASKGQGTGPAVATQRDLSPMIAESDAQSPGEPPQIWLSWVPPSEDNLDEFRSLLTDAECARMFRYTQEMDQLRFLTGRAWLRQLLSWRLQMEPRQIKLQTTARGKLFVDSESDRLSPIHFNVAHSGGLVLIAFHSTFEVGVDVEWMDHDVNWTDVARNLFSAEEYLQWSMRPSEEQYRDGFQRWTLREAEAKAVGCGLARSLDPSCPSNLRRYEIDLPEGYVGAAACVTDRWAGAEDGDDHKNLFTDLNPSHRTDENRW